MKFKTLGRIKTMLKKNKVGGFTLPNFQVLLQSNSNQDSVVCQFAYFFNFISVYMFLHIKLLIIVAFYSCRIYILYTFILLLSDSVAYFSFK